MIQHPNPAKAWLVLALLALSAANPAAADPMPGEKFPHQLAAMDQDGKPRSRQSLTGPSGLALFFVRSADWCPFCQGQLIDVNRHLDGFRALGVNVASVSVDEVPLLARFAKAQRIGYPMLSDPKGDINLSLGIRDEQYPLGTKAFGVPRPTLYVLDAKGVVRLRYQEKTFRTRPDLDAVIRDIKALEM
jgi:peroxiredoxin